jgi:hypothetical protein
MGLATRGEMFCRYVFLKVPSFQAFAASLRQQDVPLTLHRFDCISLAQLPASLLFKHVPFLSPPKELLPITNAYESLMAMNK